MEDIFDSQYPGSEEARLARKVSRVMKLAKEVRAADVLFDSAGNFAAQTEAPATKFDAIGAEPLTFLDTIKDKVFANAKTFIENGGNAEWKWIGFDYNDHQLEDAKRMSKEMGFSAFIYKNTRVRHSIIRQAMGLQDLDKGVTATSKNVNSTISKDIVKQAQKEIASVKDFANESVIKCRFRREKNYGFQVEHSGRIYQCCHLPGYYNYQQPGSKIYKEYEYYTNKYSSNWNSLDEHNIMDILNHQYFQHDLTDSFNNKTDASENPRISRCISKCGSIDG